MAIELIHFNQKETNQQDIVDLFNELKNWLSEQADKTNFPDKTKVNLQQDYAIFSSPINIKKQRYSGIELNNTGLAINPN